MISRYEVTLNGTSMGEVSENIIIKDVQYEKPKYKRNLFQLADRHGSRPGKAYKDRAAVTIVFEIHEYGVADRQRVLADIITWARNGGDLRINDRPGQKLICVCEEFPAIESVRDWTNDLSIMFAAYACPYWQEVNPTIVTHQYSNRSATTLEDAFEEVEMFVPGNAPYTLLEMRIENFETVRTYIGVENASRDDGLFDQHGGMVDGDAITKLANVLEYDENMIMQYYIYEYYEEQQRYIKKDQQGWLVGIDEIRLTCGQNNTIKFRYGQWNAPYDDNPESFTPRACTVTFTARGLWE